MQVPSTTNVDNSNVALSKRQQRAASRAGKPDTQAEVTQQVAEKRLPPEPKGGVTFINNADNEIVHDLNRRLKKLSEENEALVNARDTAQATHTAVIARFQEKLAAAEKEKVRMQDLLAVKNVSTAAPAQVVYQEKAVILLDDLKNIMIELLPCFDMFRALHVNINDVRQKLKTLMNNNKISVEVKKTEFDKLRPQYKDSFNECIRLRKKVEDNLQRLKNMSKLGTYEVVSEIHVGVMQSMNMNAETIKENQKKYAESLADCNREIALMDQEYAETKDRFGNARDHVNAIINVIDPRGSIVGNMWYGVKENKYEYVTSPMEGKVEELKAMQ